MRETIPVKDPGLVSAVQDNFVNKYCYKWQKNKALSEAILEAEPKVKHMNN